MNLGLYILAEGDSTLKIVIGLIFAGIWVIAQIASALGKKKDQTPTADYEIPMPEHAPPPMPRPEPRQPPKRRLETRSEPQSVPRYEQPQMRPDPPVMVPRQPPKQKKAASKQRRHQPQSQTLQSAERHVSLPPPIVRRTESQVRTVAQQMQPIAARVAAEGPNKSQRLRAILSPSNLRKEFLMTEILRKPIGLREDHLD